MKRILISCLLAVMLGLVGCGSTPSATTEQATQPQLEDVQLVVFIRGAQPDVGDSFEIGQPLRVKDTGTLLGEISDIVVEESLSAVPDAEGELHAARSPVLVDIWLTVDGQATVSDNGFQFGSEFAYVNNDIKYLTPFTQFAGIITEMKVAGE